MYCALLCSILGQSEAGQIGQNNVKRSIIIRCLGELGWKLWIFILILDLLIYLLWITSKYFRATPNVLYNSLVNAVNFMNKKIIAFFCEHIILKWVAIAALIKSWRKMPIPGHLWPYILNCYEHLSSRFNYRLLHIHC